MSDNKSIQDALAEIQRKVNEERTARVSEIIDEATATMLDPSGKKIGTTQYERVPGSAAKTATTTTARNILGKAGRVLGGPAVAGALAAAEVLKPTPAGETKSEFQRQKEMGISPKPMSSISPAPKTSTDRTGTGINRVMNRGKETPAEPLKMAKVEPKTFSQAFSAARKAASEKGSPASGQFEFKGKTYQTNVKGEKYVAPPKQTTVSTTKEVPLPPKRPADLTAPSKPMSDVRDSRPTSSISPAPTPKAPETTGTLKNLPLDTSKPLGSTITKEPLDTSAPNKSKQTNLEYESGGKKKKMSEDTNPLIAAFLKLQNENSKNMFEAAKKAKKDYDKDGKIESPKDEVWGSRFRAAKMAGKMEEGMIDPKDPSVQGSGDVTSTPAKKISMPKPTAPKTDSSVQGSGDVTMNGKPTRVKEDSEVTFSQAEIDHINSFFLEASVAPNRPEVAIGADSTSDKMSQNDVTGTSTEDGKKKKIKEETDAEDETNMAKTQLKAMSAKAKNLHSKLKTSRNLPAWVQSKLAVAKDKISGVDDYMTHSDEKIRKEEVEHIEEGRPKKNPTPETTDRDPRKHIQVEAGRAAAGNVVDFHHNDGSKSKITPAMGRRIVSHLQGLKPADRQAAVNKMHDSAEGLKV